jgi:hypothetical protein
MKPKPNYCTKYTPNAGRRCRHRDVLLRFGKQETNMNNPQEPNTKQDPDVEAYQEPNTRGIQEPNTGIADELEAEGAQEPNTE